MSKNWVFGSVPYTNFKEQVRIVNKLRSEIGKKVRITIENDVIFYEYFDLQH
jgi:hypothetical protein